FTLAMADLDHFKLLNDTYGHAAGDRALRAFSSVVLGAVRADDIVGRIGGEEFVIVFPQLSVADAAGVLDRIRKLLATAGGQGDGSRREPDLAGHLRGEVLGRVQLLGPGA